MNNLTGNCHDNSAWKPAGGTGFHDVPYFSLKTTQNKEIRTREDHSEPNANRISTATF
ncbi:MAG: hypothetical protein HOH33_17560 [Verrucomicrobia bacterium]|nr:hypothetical protein [Verrucomicrobiota bacterium]